MKICSKHNEEKKPVGTQGQFKCASCNRENQAKHFAKNKEAETKRIRESSKAAVARNRDFVLAHLLTHPCVDCGESDPVVLEFDHLGNKRTTISKMVYAAVSIETLTAEIAKCEVRCANCHKRKTAKDFGWWKAQETVGS